MNKTVRITILTIVIIFLTPIVLFIMEIAPKPILMEEKGEQHSFSSISFNLESDEYKESKEVVALGLEDISNNILVFRNPNNSRWITVSHIEDAKYPIYFDERIQSLKNPVTHLKLENDLPKKINSESVYLNDETFTVDKVKMDIYKGKNKTIILSRSYYSDDSISYKIEMKLDKQYFTIIQGKGGTIKNIREFMRTVSLDN